MEHKSGEIDPSSVYYVEVFYFMGDKECMLKRSYTSPSERLVIESDLPERVYPGQKVKTKLNVTNIQGRPVSNVDLTAFAVNTQLDYHVPDLPYYGSAPRPREQRASYSMKQKSIYIPAHWIISIGTSCFIWISCLIISLLILREICSVRRLIHRMEPPSLLLM